MGTPTNISNQENSLHLLLCHPCPPPSTGWLFSLLLMIAPFQFDNGLLSVGSPPNDQWRFHHYQQQTTEKHTKICMEFMDCNGGSGLSIPLFRNSYSMKNCGVVNQLRCCTFLYLGFGWRTSSTLLIHYGFSSLCNHSAVCSLFFTVCICYMFIIILLNDLHRRAGQLQR